MNKKRNPSNISKVLTLFAIGLIVSLFTFVPAGPFLSSVFSRAKDTYAQPSDGNQEKIAFTRITTDDSEIYVMNADGSGQTNISNNPALDEYPTWSPDGEKIAFSSYRDGNEEIYVMNADGGSGVIRLTNNAAQEIFASWSPDGEKIAFTSDRDGNREIYVMNADDGSGVTRLTNNPATDEYPTWSPDSTKIAFESGRDGFLDEHHDIYVMNADDGSGVTRLTGPADQGIVVNPSWSPDGTNIATSSNRGTSTNLEIQIVNANGGSGLTRLTNNPDADGFPTWSSDGEKIAFTNNRDGNYEIYLMNADGSGQKRLTNNPGFDYTPRFSPSTCQVSSPPPVAFLVPLLTPAYGQSVPCGDLSVTSVTAVQAPDDPDFVIDGKPTLIKAKIKNTFTEPKSVDIALTAESGAAFDKVINDVPIQAGENDYYLPTTEFLTPSGPAEFQVSLALDSTRETTESNENNNIAFSIQYPIKTAKDFKVLYVPLRLAGDTNTDPTCEEVDNVRMASERYIDAIYPLNPDRTQHILDCDVAIVDVTSVAPPLGGKDQAAIFRTLQEFGWGRGVDKVVGVTRDHFLDEVLGNLGQGTVGLAKKDPLFDSVIVAKSPAISGVLTAHELGHSLLQSHNTTLAPGYWVTERIPTTSFRNGLNTLDFMDKEVPGFGSVGNPEVYYWINKQRFTDIFAFLKEPGDPPVIGISGIITKNGEADIVTLKRFEDILDIPLDHSGQYSIVYLDSSNNILGKTSFDVSFGYYDAEGETDAAPFALRIPDVEGTEKIVLKKGDQILGEKSFSGSGTTNNPPVAEDDTATTNQGVAVTIDVLANDTDLDNDPLTIDSVTSPSNGGTAVIENGKIKYSPPGSASFTGTDQFQYTVSDGKDGGTDTATVIVTVKDVTPPNTKIDSVKDGSGNTITPDGTTSSNSVTFTFSSPDSDVGKFQCSIDDSSTLQDCTTPKTYSNLAQGSHLFEVVAIDKSGNVDQSKATFGWRIEQQQAVKWTIKGFYPPVDMKDANGDPIVNTIKGGRSVPLKFEVFNEKGVELTSTGTDVITSFTTSSVSCGTLADDSTDAIEITNTDGTSLRYDSSAGQYLQNWKTPSNSAGKCFKADLETADGTHTVAYFKMTK